ncbi:MAG: RNA polymerase sigma factor [Bryobacteraceae bacterium]|nr:RNA polymerase sigma factor [Bryobacteraceae bacterium]
MRQAESETAAVDPVAQAIAGDRDAFAELVRRNQAMVFSLAVHSLRDEGVAEELAQEVFLELHRALPQLESALHVTNWLRRVTLHRCIDQSRRDKHRPRLALDEIPEPADTDRRETDFFLQEQIRKMTASLPERARALVLLRYQEDMEPTEIAQVLGLPVNTVKSQLHRALGMLREKLERRLRAEV